MWQVRGHYLQHPALYCCTAAAALYGCTAAPCLHVCHARLERPPTPLSAAAPPRPAPPARPGSAARSISALVNKSRPWLQPGDGGGSSSRQGGQLSKSSSRNNAFDWHSWVPSTKRDHHSLHSTPPSSPTLTSIPASAAAGPHPSSAQNVTGAGSSALLSRSQTTTKLPTKRGGLGINWRRQILLAKHQAGAGSGGGGGGRHGPGAAAGGGAAGRGGPGRGSAGGSAAAVAGPGPSGVAGLARMAAMRRGGSSSLSLVAENSEEQQLCGSFSIFLDDGVGGQTPSSPHQASQERGQPVRSPPPGATRSSGPPRPRPSAPALAVRPIHASTPHIVGGDDDDRPGSGLHSWEEDVVPVQSLLLMPPSGGGGPPSGGSLLAGMRMLGGVAAEPEPSPAYILITSAPGSHGEQQEPQQLQLPPSVQSGGGVSRELPGQRPPQVSGALSSGAGQVSGALSSGSERSGRAAGSGGRMSLDLSDRDRESGSGIRSWGPRLATAFRDRRASYRVDYAGSAAAGSGSGPDPAHLTGSGSGLEYLALLPRVMSIVSMMPQSGGGEGGGKGAAVAGQGTARDSAHEGAERDLPGCPAGMLGAEAGRGGVGGSAGSSLASSRRR